jgi:soluble lytic murein transglycosylase-like protein
MTAPGRASKPWPPGDISRRRCLGAASLATLAPLWPALATAGSQLEEPLADSVRSALSAAIASQSPPVPVFTDAGGRLIYQRWTEQTHPRLQASMPDGQIRQEFLQTVWYESQRARLDVAMVLGLIQIESNFRKFAVSSAGARGYMQIMPFWARLIGDGDASKLFQVQLNLRFGCVILRHYLEREQGEMFMALGRYNGSRGQAPYPQAVLRASSNWLSS